MGVHAHVIHSVAVKVALVVIVVVIIAVPAQAASTSRDDVSAEIIQRLKQENASLKQRNKELTQEDKDLHQKNKALHAEVSNSQSTILLESIALFIIITTALTAFIVLRKGATPSLVTDTLLANAHRASVLEEENERLLDEIARLEDELQYPNRFVTDY